MAQSYLALGDSYTIGEGVDAAERWPVQLVQALRHQGMDIDSPRIIATTGWTTDELSDAMDTAEPLGQWDYVSLLIGVNNQYRERSVEEYRVQFQALLQRAIGLSRTGVAGVFVVSIPDWGVTPFAQGRDREMIAKAIDAFNQVAREVCELLSVRFIDITPLSRDGGEDPVMLAADGLHPSGLMYSLWMENILKCAGFLTD